MARAHSAAILGAVLAAMAVALTVDDFTRPVDLSDLFLIGAGVLVLPALIAATWRLVVDTRQTSPANAWAKSALALAVSLPLAWIATSNIVWSKLIGVPDGDMPDGLVERMNADVLQMQAAALLVEVSVLACIAMAWRRMEDAGP